jgi:hypothetical protein
MTICGNRSQMCRQVPAGRFRLPLYDSDTSGFQSLMFTSSSGASGSAFTSTSVSREGSVSSVSTGTSGGDDPPDDMSISEVAAIERDLALAGRGVRDERLGLRGDGDGEGSMRGGVGGRREKVFCYEERQSDRLPAPGILADSELQSGLTLSKTTSVRVVDRKK